MKEEEREEERASEGEKKTNTHLLFLPMQKAAIEDISLIDMGLLIHSHSCQTKSLNKH